MDIRFEVLAVCRHDRDDVTGRVRIGDGDGDGDEKSAPGDGDDGYDGDEYDDAREELSRRRRRRARAASLALLAEADSSYELAAKIFRSIEGSVGSAAYEEPVVRMDLVDDAIAEERRKGREDRERASL